jgi:hypothetical protein
MTQGNLFDPELGRTLGEAGRDLSYSNEEARNPDWPRVSLDAIIRTAKRLETLTTDDVWAELREFAGEINGSALGGAMVRAARAGVIRRLHGAEGVPSKRPSRHCSMLRVWESLIYEGNEVAPCV